MYCVNCGKETPDDSVFCQHCGSNQSVSGINSRSKPKIKLLSKVHSIAKALVPYTSIIAIAIGIMNLIYIKESQEDIKYAQNQIINLKNEVDNSEIINTINEAHYSILEEINEAEIKLRRHITIWGN